MKKPPAIKLPKERTALENTRDFMLYIAKDYSDNQDKYNRQANDIHGHIATPQDIIVNY